MSKGILKQLLENDIKVAKEVLENNLKENEMILDGMVIDVDTFEDIREATENELRCFYAIRINEMRLRMLEEQIPR